MQNPFEPSTLSRLLLGAGAVTWIALAGCGAADDTTADSEAPADSTVGDPGAGGAAPAGDEHAGEAGAALRGAGRPAAGAPLFTAPEPWTKDVSTLAKSTSSDEILGWLGDHGGWGTKRLRIEMSIKLLHADASTPFRTFTPTDDFYAPDCDQVPFPLPRGGALEDEDGYQCTTDGDCHLLVVHEPSGKLYEMWRANVTDQGFSGGCAAVWDLHKSYDQGRGQSCTSADAGGFPVSAMLFTADEVARGSIDHAIRFILPNARIRRGVYVWPATHASRPLTGGPSAPPYGVHLRLRRDFPLESLPSEGARVIARAMQRYGMLLADGGRVPLTAADDRFTEHKWAEVGVDPDSMGGVQVSDMEVVDLGEPRSAKEDCARN
jgi:serine/threonine-protein kinase